MLTKKSFGNSPCLIVYFYVFLYFLCTPLCRTCDYLLMRTYLTTVIFLIKTRENNRYIYREIDTHYYKQTTCTTPFGVKAYASQSNPLHFWVAFDKNQNFHLTCGTGTNQRHICKISPITKVDYPFEFCKKPRENTIKKFNAQWKNSAREKQSLPEKILKILPEKKKIQTEKKYEKCARET